MTHSDEEIVRLFLERDEQALAAAKAKYGKLLRQCAKSIVGNENDAEECESEAYYEAWLSIPPTRPASLKGFLVKIVRNLACKRLRARTADKRGEGETALCLDELSECIPDGETVETQIEAKELSRLIDRFVNSLSAKKKQIFVLRYFYCMPVKEIAGRCGENEGRIKMTLMRLREKLRQHLHKEGIDL